jgi:hypothetical protein
MSDRRLRIQPDSLLTVADSLLQISIKAVHLGTIGIELGNHWVALDCCSQEFDAFLGLTALMGNNCQELPCEGMSRFDFYNLGGELFGLGASTGSVMFASQLEGLVDGNLALP